MDSLIETVAAWPFNLFVYSGIVMAAVALGSLALRRLGRWWRGRREAERKQRTAVEQFQDECRAEDMRDYYGWYFKQGGWGDAPEQPGKRAECDFVGRDALVAAEAAIPNDGGSYEIARYSDGVNLRRVDKPKPPYGSKPSEDAKPVRRDEYENDIRVQDAVNESLSARVAALEARGNDVPKCHFCGGSGMITELSEDSTVPTRQVPCPGCQVRYTIRYY